MAKTTQAAKAAPSLKEQNRSAIWTIIAINVVFLYTVSVARSITVNGTQSLSAAAAAILPVGITAVVTTLLNGLISSDAKASLVFVRLRHALPGHRAFSVYTKADPRIDLVAIERSLGTPVPNDPDEQNRTWYRMYRAVENDPAVAEIHKNFLLLRDYTALSALFLICLGSIGLYTIHPFRIWCIYVVLLVVQLLVARQAAYHYGTRMVTTVLARTMYPPPEQTGVTSLVDSKKKPKK